MNGQLMISIGREFGSGGHEIAEKIAKELGLNFYDRNILEQIAVEKHVNSDTLKNYDEKGKKLFLTRSVGKYTTSIEQNLAEIQFDFIRKKADSGESFVIVGRCAESVLRGREGLVSVFVLGDEEEKLRRIEERFNISSKEADIKRKRQDTERKQYHNEHSMYKWGDSRGYDLCINSSRLGIDGTVKAIMDYINLRTNQ